jgi:hypothetical protein
MQWIRLSISRHALYSFPTCRHAGDFAFQQTRNVLFPHMLLRSESAFLEASSVLFPHMQACSGFAFKYADFTVLFPHEPACRGFAFQKERSAPFPHMQACRRLRLPRSRQCPLSPHTGMQGTSPSNKNAMPPLPTCRHAGDFAFQQERNAPFTHMQACGDRLSTSKQCTLHRICLSTQSVLFPTRRQAVPPSYRNAVTAPPPPYRAGTLFNPLFPVRARE